MKVFLLEANGVLSQPDYRYLTLGAKLQGPNSGGWGRGSSFLSREKGMASGLVS